MNKSQQREVAAWIRYQHGLRSTANEEHVEIAKQGREAIRKWREHNPAPAHLNLSGAHLYKVDLSGADLEGAELTGAFLVGANLRGASLRWTKLQGTHLTEADLRDATFYLTDLSGAHLDGANLSDLDLSQKTLKDIDMTDAVLVGANLREARCVGTKMSGASLEAADLRGARGLVLDENLIRGARFSRHASDPWSVLRRNYTGTRLLFLLLLLMAFIVPLVARTAFWVSVNRAETALTSAAIRAKATDTLREYTVWQLLVGVDRGVTAWGLTLALLVYNLCRGILTALVGPLRDEEERTGISPRLSGWRRADGVQNLHHLLDGYGWLVWPHRVTRALWYVAIGSFVWHTWRWLSAPVWLPPS